MKKILIIIVSSLVFIVGISLYFYYSFGRPINRRIMAGTQTASLGDYLYHKYTDINDPLINEVKNEFNLFSDTDYKILEEHIINRQE